MSDAARRPSPPGSTGVGPGGPPPQSAVFAGLGEKLRELESAAARQQERFLAILEIVRAVGSTLDLDEILKRVIHHVTRLLGCERATLFLIDRDRRELWSKIAEGPETLEIRHPLDVGIAGHTARTGEAVNVADAPSDPRFYPEVDRRTGFTTRNVLAVPLRDKAGTVIGVIEALNQVPGAFSGDDQALLGAIAAQTAVAMENARLYGWAVERNRQLSAAQEALRAALLELDVLFAIEKEVSAAQNFPQLLDALIAKAMALVQVEAGSVLIVEEETGDLYFKGALGEKGEEVKRLKLKAGQGIAGAVARAGRSIVANDARTHPAFDPSIARKIGFETRSVLCVPIATAQETIGALELCNKTANRFFNDADERIATLIAAQTARAIAISRDREEGERWARLAMLGQMISGVLHDLRTPLTIVSGYAQLVVNETEKKEREASAHVILRQVDHIDAMVRETLSFARGEREILVRRVYLDKFIDEVGMYLAKDFEGKSIALKVVDTYRGAARFDEVKIKRAIYNIARNAAEAMPNGGEFTFAVDQEDSKVVFRFTDTGGGIPDEIAPSLFKSFVTRGKVGGTGLGLAVVKTVVDQHGGDVSFESVPGKGTTFTLRIPS